MLKKLLLFPLFFSFYITFSQIDTLYCKVAFYNVENLFDPANDSLKNDDTFTPEGFNGWTYKRYYRKIGNIGKVILAMGAGNPPGIVGLAEIENAKTLKDLCYNSPLKNYRYRFIHYDSPDNRGIDVALLYRPDQVEILHSEPLPVVFPFEPSSQNRDILYVVAVIHQYDTLHLFVNHWTSRYGGYAPTIPKRNYYAEVVRKKYDSIWHENHAPNIIIMGDFNDYPDDESMQIYLQAQRITKDVNPQKLYNLMASFSSLENIGSHKYEEFWGCLDQLIVSGNLLQDNNPLQVLNRKAVIFKANFMMEPDKRYGGEKPFRTYLGPRYFGGYADHLPVYLSLSIYRGNGTTISSQNSQR